ncbi:MAG: hypothetical protein KDA60_03885 [Planctomycetales bacterium]|nr:hypothetical protein [Planctomycetales bacterium]
MTLRFALCSLVASLGLVVGSAATNAQTTRNAPTRPQAPAQRPSAASVAPRAPSARPTPTRASTNTAQTNAPRTASNSPTRPNAVRLQLAAGPQTPAQALPQQPTPVDPRLSQILTHWEQESQKVKTFSCRFVRWEYDAFSVLDPQTKQLIPTAKSEGIVRYAAIDKGEFKVEQRGTLDAAKLVPGKSPDYAMQNVFGLEHWVCDGKSVFELDGVKKELIEHQIPADMQGQAITDGPLPFMFGATKDKLLTRYYIKELIFPNRPADQFWLEVRPRLRADAQNFQSLIVVLDKEMFLPVAMQVFEPSNDPTNPTKKSYQFLDRKKNDLLAHNLKQFMGGFIAPRVPPGWKKVVDSGTPAGPTAPTPRAANSQRTNKR